MFLPLWNNSFIHFNRAVNCFSFPACKTLTQTTTKNTAKLTHKDAAHNTPTVNWFCFPQSHRQSNFNYMRATIGRAYIDSIHLSTAITCTLIVITTSVRCISVCIYTHIKRTRKVFGAPAATYTKYALVLDYRVQRAFRVDFKSARDANIM